MATLQKLRDKGSKLLIGFVGVALFAFIAGDIVKLFQKEPTPEVIIVGSINGEDITYDEFFQFREKYESYVSLMQTLANNEIAVLKEGDQEYITKEAWDALVRLKTLTSKAINAGLAVTPEELDYYVQNVNWSMPNNIVMPPVFLNNGFFDVNAYNSMLDFIESCEGMPLSGELAVQYDICNKAIIAWGYIETSIICDILEEKLVNQHFEEKLAANKEVAKSNFELDNNSYKIEVAAYPYSNVTEEQVVISENDILNHYNAIKETEYRVDNDIHSIAYIVQEVAPDTADLAKLEKRFIGYAEDLKEENADINAIAIRSSSNYKYDGYLWPESTNRFGNYFNDIKKCEEGEVEVLGANRMDNTYALIHTVRKEIVPDSIKFRYIAIQHRSDSIVTETTNSLLAELNNNVAFDSIAKDYQSETFKFSTSDFLGLLGFDQNRTPVLTPEMQSQIYAAKKNAYEVIDINPNLKLILQVLEKEGEVEAHDALVIERKIQISNNAYSNKFEELSQMIASCNNVEDFVNTPNVRFADVDVNDANIAGIPGTKALLKWVLNGNNGNISDILTFNDYEYPNKKYMMVVGVTNVTPKGYFPLNEAIEMRIKKDILNEKKADYITGLLHGKNWEELQSVENVVFSNEPIANVNYKKETYIETTGAHEAAISSAVAKMQEGEISDPIKGEKAVYVVKVISKEPRNLEFNEEEEMRYIMQDEDINSIIKTIRENTTVVNRVYEHM